MIPASHAPVWVTDAIKDYESAGVSPAMLLYVDGELLTRDLKTLNWGWGQDGAAQLANLTLGGRIPSDFAGAEVVIKTEIAGWDQEMFVSKKMRLEHPNNDWITNITAATAGSYASEWKLQQDFELTAWPPQAVARYFAAKLPYDQSDIRIHRFDTPLLSRTGPSEGDPEDLSFSETDVVQAGFDVVDSEVLCIYYDTARGLRFEPDPGYGGNSAIDWDFRRGSPEIISWPAPQELSPDEQYAEVVVLAKNESGGDRIRVSHGVNQQGRRFPAREGQIKYLDWSDTSVSSEAKAAAYCKLEAEKLGRGLHHGQSEVVYNPFIFPGRVFQFEEPYRDNAGTWQRVWIGVVKKNVKHDDAGGRMSTSFGYESVKTFEELVAVPTLILFGISSPVLAGHATKVAPRHYAYSGYDEEGFWLDPGKVGWMGRDDDGFYIAYGPLELDGAGHYAGEDEDEDYIVTNKKFTHWGQTDITFKEMNVPFSYLP